MQLNFVASDTSLYQIELADGTTAKFHLLDYNSFVRCKALLERNPVMIPLIEEEIFRTCVVDPIYIVDHMFDQKAGTISSIATAIYMTSGPHDINVVNEQFELGRKIVQDVTYNMILHICRAFPAYNPDDLLCMDWQTLVNRFVLAEKLLLDTGAISEKINVQDSSQPEQAKQPRLRGARPPDMRSPAPAKFDFAREAADHGEVLGYNMHEEDDLRTHKQSMLEVAKAMIADRQKRGDL